MTLKNKYMYEIDTPPKLIQVVTDAKFYGVDRDIRGVCCFMKERIDKSGWDGYAISLKYNHEQGYYYDITPIGMGSGIITFLFDNDKASADMNRSMEWLGECPKCNQKLFNPFNWEFHNVNNCGNKKAIANNSEC